jgi:hypothetical protein
MQSTEDYAIQLGWYTFLWMPPSHKFSHGISQSKENAEVVPSNKTLPFNELNSSRIKLFERVVNVRICIYVRSPGFEPKCRY